MPLDLSANGRLGNRFLRPIVAVRVTRPIGLLESVNKRGDEGLDSLLANCYPQNLDVRRITRLSYVVCKARVPGETKIISDGDLPVEVPLSSPFSLR